MLKAQGIRKAYNQLVVLKDIHLEVAKGEIISIVGASGAGKSTLLHILGTLDAPDAGQVWLDGEEIQKKSATTLARFRNQRIGFIFQFHNLLAEFSALENVMIPGLIGGTSRSQAEKRASDLLVRLGLGHRLHHKPSELSGGEQQRSAVARALVNGPAVVFADEPSGNLDSQNARDLHQLFFDLRKEFGYTFVIVTHNTELADMADRKLEIKDGKIVN
ncbi:MAG: ABC transporter ATP-binding protein [Cyclobacteriaceae bacterium]|jgi:lipoprotein-releasing system ATP-binding protein|nr:ABC transporter ATP-binding protein [Flammeovirgaceae bacterium]